MALISRWTLENTANDLYGVYNGTNVGTITYSTDSKEKGYSVYNAGSASNYINLGNWSFNSYTNFTITGWFKSSSTDPVRLLCNVNTGALYPDIILVVYSNLVNYIVINNSNVTLLNKNSGDIGLSDGNWHHCALIDANGTVTCYIDGRIISAMSGSYTRASLSTNIVAMSGQPTTPAYGSKGNIDDIRFYDVALTADEVMNLYKSYNTPRWDQPLSRWKLDGDATDSAGTNNGTAVGTLSYSTSIKVYGSQAFTNAGGANYINLGTFRMLSYTAFSLSLWVKYSGTGSRGIISQCTTTNDAGFWRFITGSITGELYLQVLNDAGGVLFNVGTTTNYNDNKWHHVVIIDNNGVISSYIDGKSGPISGSYTRPTLSSNNASLAGSISKTNIYYWNGSLDDVRFYDVALSAAEIKALYASYFTEKAANFMSTLV